MFNQSLNNLIEIHEEISPIKSSHDFMISLVESNTKQELIEDVN